MQGAVAFARPPEHRRDHRSPSGMDHLHPLHPGPEAGPRRRDVAALLRALGIDDRQPAGAGEGGLVPDLAQFVPSLRETLERELEQWEIVIRAPEITRL